MKQILLPCSYGKFLSIWKLWNIFGPDSDDEDSIARYDGVLDADQVEAMIEDEQIAEDPGDLWYSCSAPDGIKALVIKETL